MMRRLIKLEPDKIGDFFECKTNEKILIFCIEDCLPCLKLKEDIAYLLKNGALDEVDIFSCQFDLRKPEHIKIFTEIEIISWPTSLYFLGGYCVGIKRGFIPKMRKNGARSLLDWIERKRNNAKKKIHSNIVSKFRIYQHKIMDGIVKVQ